jgi:mannan endo-1,4-beta-mannosidase
MKITIKRRRLGIAGVIGAPVAIACGLLIAFAGGGRLPLIPGFSFGFGAGGSPPPVVCPAKAPALPLIGVSPATPWEAGLVEFDSDTHTKPHLAVSYVSFGRPFPAPHACLAVAQGGEILVQMNPVHQNLGDIAAGKYDSYLTRFANEIVESRAPVVFSFAHEMNGDWYPWGFGQTSPAVYIAAWRHIWRVFHKAGANVTWCWNVNRYDADRTPRVAPPGLWWPGHKYVTWVGIDAYYKDPGDNYGDVFGSTITAVRQFTAKPVLIAETAAGPGPQRAAQIRGLFAGAERAHLVGVVWFDINRREAWQIDGDKAALSAFHFAATAMAAGRIP